MLRLCVSSSKSMTLKTVKKTVRQIPLRLHMRLQKSVLVEMVHACFHLSMARAFFSFKCVPCVYAMFDSAKLHPFGRFKSKLSGFQASYFQHNDEDAAKLYQTCTLSKIPV